MEIKTRKQAIIDGDNKFFTGKICINGHLSYRYVQSGTCSECIHGTPIRNKNSSDVNKSQMINNTITIVIEVQYHSISIMMSVVHGFAVLRWPHVTASEVWAKQRPKYGVLYKIRCHADDREEIIKISVQFLNYDPKPFVPIADIREEKFSIEDLMK